jgi:hypothetical protein
MPSVIKVQQTAEGDPMAFLVTVKEGKSATQHHVTMSASTYQKLTGGKVSAAHCIEAAFKFLLEREPKESILSSFDVTVISTYFPSFEQEARNYC